MRDLNSAEFPVLRELFNITREVVAGVLATTSLFSVCLLIAAQPSSYARHEFQPPIQEPSNNLYSFSDAALAEARRFLLNGEFALCLREIKRLAKSGVAPKLIYAAEAEVFRRTAYLDRELDSLHSWAKADPKNEEPQLRLFYKYFDLGWTAEASERSGLARKISPSAMGSLTAAAILQYRSDEPSKALPFVDLAIRQSPSNDRLLNLKASILIKSHMSAVAVPFLRQTLKRNPSYQLNQEALAMALLQIGKEVEAKSIFRQLQLQNPAHIESAYHLGLLAQKQGDVNEAIHQFEKASRLNIKHNNVSFLLGQLYLTHGKVEEGRKLLALYKKLDGNTAAYNQTMAQLRSRPKDAGLHYKMAQFHLGSDELPQAIVELRRVLQLQPIHPSARQELAKALNDNGRATEARELIQGAANRLRTKR